MRFVIQIFDDADLAFRVFGAELRTVLSTTTVLADKPLRLSGRAIAQRFSCVLGMFSSLEVKVLYPT
jgi:hypothetical protein